MKDQAQEHSAKPYITAVMMSSAETDMFVKNYKGAIETYKRVLKIEPNIDAMYNLGSLYAQGKGVEVDFTEAAYWFHQAALAGDEQAEKMCLKCTFDYVHTDIDTKSPERLYSDMIIFEKRVYPETDSNEKLCNDMYLMALNHIKYNEYSIAVKLFRASAEFGNDEDSQNALGVLYNAGDGVEKNDLSALYWFDKATDNGVEDARKDRKGILNAYRNCLEDKEFAEHMRFLSDCCRLGSLDIPKDPDKATYWREFADMI